MCGAVRCGAGEAPRRRPGSPALPHTRLARAALRCPRSPRLPRTWLGREEREGWAGCSPGIGALQCSQVLAQLPIWSGISSALLRLSEEREEEDDEEEKEQRQSGSQRTPLPGGNRGARSWCAAHAPGAMAETGEGGEDEIQFLRTVSLRGRARRRAGGEERGAARRGCAAPRCGARSPHSRAAEADLPPTLGAARGCVGSGTFSSLSPLWVPPPLTLRSPTRDSSLLGQLATWSETFDAQTSSWA